MINAVADVMTQKTIDQYKIIEDKYLVLKRYLRLLIEENNFIEKKDIEIIIKALDDEPIEIKERNDDLSTK